MIAKPAPSKLKNFEQRILYIDNHLLVVNKLAGEIVQGDKTGDQPMSDLAKWFLKVHFNKPGDVFLGVTHRIDRPTSGIVVFARTSKALSRLNKMFRDKEIQKLYFAVTANRPQNAAGSLEHFLKKNQKQNKSYVVDSGVKEAKLARLEFEVVESKERVHFWKIVLQTGRHHQIRVQLSTIECPIRGDVKYGSRRPNADKSIHLHAGEVEFVHPVKKEKISIVAPFPNEKVWNLFSGVNKSNH